MRHRPRRAVFKTAGDAFHAAFATAPDSIAAALSAQQALRAERWPEGLPIRVRMAVHTEAAELREGDYFGPPLNYAARLCRDQLPVGATLKPLGTHALKDVGSNEAVFQLCDASLIDSFPPLRTSAASPVADTTPSIAVLPFTELSAEKDQEYFADGLAEELLNVLSKIRGLRVASRTSAFHFKGKDVDIPTVAQSLNVATILEGSVRKSAKRVRISAQLIDVARASRVTSRGSVRARHVQGNSKHPNRPHDVLDLLLADVIETHINIPVHLFAYGTRHADPTRFSERLEPRRDVLRGQPCDDASPFLLPERVQCASLSCCWTARIRARSS